MFTNAGIEPHGVIWCLECPFLVLEMACITMYLVELVVILADNSSAVFKESSWSPGQFQPVSACTETCQGGSAQCDF